MSSHNLYTHCLRQALRKVEIPYQDVGETGISTRVRFGEKNFYFVSNKMPLNNSVVSHIAKDKGLTYDLLHQYIQMPRTRIFVDPKSEPADDGLANFSNLQAVEEKITANFEYPLIIKKNTGSEGDHVFLCADDQEMHEAVKSVFREDSVLYDTVLLAQEAIQIAREFSGKKD